MVEIIQISPTDKRYPLEQELRNTVLLRPYGLPDNAWEMRDEEAFHFVAIFEEVVCGCLLLWPADENKDRLQLMQMAVTEELQGKSVGYLLMIEAIDFAQEKGYKEIFCHARVNSVPFYLRQGFEIYGQPFEEVGIQHRYMRRYLKSRISSRV